MQVTKSQQSKKVGYRDLLNEKNYILQTLATIISRFGDGIDTIAFSILVYKITGSTLLVATLFGINGIPNIIFGVISGVVCKYFTDKKIMAICDFGRCICVALISVLYITGNLTVWHLYVITFLNSSFESFRGPAATSIVPKIISNEKLEHGIALSSAGAKTAELIGLAIAPVIISMLSLGGAIIIDATTFLICGLLITLLKFEDKVIEDDKLTIKTYFKDLKEGISYIKKKSLILNIVVFAAIINALTVPYNSLQAPYVKEVLDVGNIALSIMSISLLIGVTVTTIFAPAIKEMLGNKKMFILGGILVGVTYSIMSLLDNLPELYIYVLLAIDIFILGIGALLVNFPLQVIMMKKVPREYLARVASIFNAVALCAVPLASFIIGIISEFINIKSLFMLFGIAVIILFVIQNFSKVMKKYDEC